MNNTKDFPFERARRITAKEVALARKAIEQESGAIRRPRGRPRKHKAEKYLATSIRLHPKAIAWAKCEARRLGVKYQTVINNLLLERAG